MNEIERKSAEALSPSEVRPEGQAPESHHTSPVIHETQPRDIQFTPVPQAPVPVPTQPAAVPGYAPQPVPQVPPHPGFAMPNITIVNQNVQPQAAQQLMMANQKSVGLAMVLTFFFGPLGMLYSTVTGAIVMFVLDLVIAVPTGGFALAILWPIQLIWTYSGVKSHNSKLYVRAA